jgi:tRNA(Met) cytidine acetyltransferase
MTPRRLVVVRGDAHETHAAALRCVSATPEHRRLWIDDSGAPGTVTARDVKRILGSTVDVAVLDGHGAFDANALGQAEGMIARGGALVLRLPGTNDTPPDAPRFRRRLDRLIAAAPTSGAAQFVPPGFSPTATPEQDALVVRLTDWLDREEPGAVVLVADRGRGKSATLGRVVRRVGDRCAISGPNPAACREIVRFAEPSEPPFVDAAWLAAHGCDAPVIVIDEAAQLPVPVLARIVARHPHTRLIFSTTVHGYEGTGRGFMLRFVPWLRERGLLREQLGLREPIRYDAGDPVERFVRDALLLDAEPHGLEPAPQGPLRCERLDRDRLAADDRTLSGVFGLLVAAHYRTTPSDLVHLLDAPDIDVHAARLGDAVVGVNLVAHERPLSPSEEEAQLAGGPSLAGHALHETLVRHLGHADAARLSFVRSVRIATHPDARRRGVARAMVEHCHASYAPDAFGTLHSGSEELLRFRRAVGYELVRMSAGRGARTGEPSVTMLRPVSEYAHLLFARLRSDLSRDLPAQLELLTDGDGMGIDTGLREALLLALPTAPAHGWRPERVRAYANGPLTLETAIADVRAFLLEYRSALGELPSADAAALTARVLERTSWTEAMVRAEAPTVAATMRLARRAFRDVVARAAPDLLSANSRGNARSETPPGAQPSGASANPGPTR